MLAVQADGHEITTVEGLATSDTELSPLQEAFRDNHGLQCGFCTPGMLTTLTEFLRDNPDPDRAGGAGRDLRQPLPLHRLPEHRRRGAGRGEAAPGLKRSGCMKRVVCIAFATALCWQRARPRAEDQLKLAIGARGNWETAASELGQNAGFFKKRGLQLEILYTQGSGETQQAVISGSVEIGIGLGTTSVMAAFAKGAPVRVIGNASTGSSEFWYVPANSPVQNMQGAAGKTIAYSTNGSSSHLEVLAFIKHYGIDAKPVGTGGTAATFTQVMSGQVDVGWSSPPFGIGRGPRGQDSHHRPRQ